MHSTQFTAAAQSADEHLAKSIVAMMDLPASDGTYPAAHVICTDDDGVMGAFPKLGAADDDTRKFSVHRVIFPDGRAPFFDNGEYNLTRGQAFKLWQDRCARDIMRD